MMLSIGLKTLQSGLGMLLLSSACAASPSHGESSPDLLLVSLPPASETRLAQNVPDRDRPRSESVPNAAGLSLQMFADQSAGVGSKVSFRVTSKKPGYLLLVDIDANGRMSQIFP